MGAPGGSPDLQNQVVHGHGDQEVVAKIKHTLHDKVKDLCASIYTDHKASFFLITTICSLVGPRSTTSVRILIV